MTIHFLRGSGANAFQQRLVRLHQMSLLLTLVGFFSLWTVPTLAQHNSRSAHLAENRPWRPHTAAPKLITPQWVGEPGVDAVVILAIDDMRDPGRYENYLRPILNRLKKIDGRAPVSIMTNSVNPQHPQLQRWIKEGLSIEVHTADHPCPLLHGGNFARAKSTYDRCVDMLAAIPNTQGPVAFRMPCCDSLNTVSPRFYSEIFDRLTPQKRFLHISSSVFNTFTPKDKSIPRKLLYDKNGRQRFDKYIPHQSATAPRYRFINFIENYPYPYVINRTCWEFPCVVPSDWEGQNLHRPNNPITLDDMKAALDITVMKKGVYCLVFHPHAWIRNTQVIDLIDHATSRYGKRVKFLNFPEALQRLNQHLLQGNPLRDRSGKYTGTKLVDVNNDGFLDVVIGNHQRKTTRVWNDKQKKFAATPFHANLLDNPTNPANDPAGFHFTRLSKNDGSRFVTIRGKQGFASGGVPGVFSAFQFKSGKWIKDPQVTQLFRDHVKVRQAHPAGPVSALHFEHLTDDGLVTCLISRNARKPRTDAVRWQPKDKSWRRLELNLPADVSQALGQKGHPRVRFVDLNDDGQHDIVFSPSPKPGQPSLQFWLMDWNAGRATSIAAPNSLPTMPILRADGSDNGFFVRDRHLCWQNEDTNRLPHLVRRVSFDSVLHEHLVKQIQQGKFPPPRSPERSAALIKVKDGLRVELVAAEPLIRDPVAFDWDVHGKLWVVEMGDYPSGTGNKRAGGRVQVLTDSNGDGRYDKAHTFLDNIPFPNGIQLWRDGVLITAAPNILFAKDTTGDGKADLVRILYRGFVEGNQQHRVNGLRWGLDNWLYVANGDSGGRVQAVASVKKQTIKGQPVTIGGRDLRIRPDRGLIDPQSGQAQFGRNRDDWGNWFGCNNSNPMWQYVLADHYLRGNPHAIVRNTRHVVPQRPGAAPVFPISRTLPRYNDFRGINRFTSACSTIIYRDNWLGDQYYGNSFTSEPVHNLISRRVLTRNGVTYRGRRAADEAGSEFLASRDNWFRPTMIRTGPDGALWFADMYRAVIEHPKWIPADWQQRLNLRAGHNLGRIYRVVRDPTPACCGQTAAKKSAPDERSFLRRGPVGTDALVLRLLSRNGWWRDTAQRMLVHAQGNSAVPLLEKLLRKSDRATTRLHALCTLAGLDAVSSPILRLALQDKHAEVRRHAIRISERLMNNPDVAQAIALRVTDRHPVVQMQLAYTARKLPHAQAGPVLATILVDQQNNSAPWIRSAAYSSLTKENVGIVLREAIRRSIRQQELARLIGQAAAFKQVKSLEETLLQLLPAPGDPIKAKQWTSLAGVARELRRHPVLESIRESKALHARWQKSSQAAVALINNGQTALATRLAALEFAGVLGGADSGFRQACAELIVPQSPQALQLAAVGVLAQSKSKDVPGKLLANWSSHSPTLRQRILDALLQQRDYRDSLLQAVQEKRIAAVDIDAVRRDRLTRQGTKAQIALARKLLKVAPNSSRQAVVTAHADVLKMQGNVERGRRVFGKRCATCHRYANIGRSIGADLAALRDRSGRTLLTAILDPNKAVEAKFLNFNVLTEEGRSLSGMLLTETGTSITLIGADGKEIVIARKNIDKLQGTNRSLMPEGLERDLSKQDLADVIRFLQVKTLPRKKFPGNTPRVIAANGKGELLIPATAAEIYGPSIVLEQRFKNLGYWSSRNDHAAWTIQVAKAGKYQVIFDYAVQAAAAGDLLQLSVAGSALSGRVPSTRTWENYQIWKLGTVELPAGISRLTVFTKTKPKSAMIDLRTIRLVPVK